MKIGYYKVGNVRKPDGSDFNICGFNDKKAEVVLNNVGGYTRSNFIEVKTQDGTPYYIPAGVENSETQSGASRLKIRSSDNTLEVLDWKSAYDDVSQNSTLTLKGTQYCKQTSVSLGYGKYRYTNTYTFKIQIITKGSLSWSEWMDILWPSGIAVVEFRRAGESIPVVFDKNTTMRILSGRSSFVETNTTGIVYSCYLTSLYLYPEMNITIPQGNRAVVNPDFGQYESTYSLTRTLEYMTGNK